MHFKDFYLLQEKKFLTISNQKIEIDIENLDLYSTSHSDQQMNRLDNYKRMNITEDEIIKDLEKALPKIMNDYANGEIENEAEFLVKNKETKLNIIGALKMRKGKDFISIITVMRKPGYIPKDGTYTYEI
ncbi:MAG: hypothetical protein WC554_15355 [Clostridia bacterium]|jgi:bifunctional ADP-heptose synthase (sugar kinase/adenylyltransferase)